MTLIPSTNYVKNNFRCENIILYVELAMKHYGITMWNFCKSPYNLVNSSLNLLSLEKLSINQVYV